MPSVVLLYSALVKPDLVYLIRNMGYSLTVERGRKINLQ